MPAIDTLIGLLNTGHKTKASLVSNRNRRKLFVFFVACLFLMFFYPNTASATHLVGGSITYRYIGQFNGRYRFEITVDMFRDGSQRPPPLQNTPPTPFDPTIDIAIFERKRNPTDTMYTTHLVLNLISDKLVQPPAATEACKSSLPKTYIYESNYEKGTVDLLPSDYGYYLRHVRCCRNTMLNVPDNTGQTYFAIIPPTTILNTTPVFNAVPSPYISQNDTVSLNYSATEPDGDSLSYSLARPYAGGDSITPIVTYSPGSAWDPIPLVNYNPGYSPANPLSKKGFVTIDPLTGVLTLKAPYVGRYAIAVDVHEYRNGIPISVTRRDVQIIAVSIPYHPPPHRVALKDSLPGDNTTSNTFTIEAGYRLSFNLEYQADSTIAVFNSAGFPNNPGGVVHKPFFQTSINDKIANAYFNWQTTCKDANPSPYTFTITVTDENCPQKTLYDGIKIFVIPFKGATHINGPSPACQNTLSYYSTNTQKKGYKLSWFVTGGTFTKGNNDSTIKVIWTNPGFGTIKVIGYNPETGCTGDTVIKIIKINPKPLPPAVTGPPSACVGNVSTFSVNSSATFTYTWSVGGGTIQNPAPLNKSIQVKWLKADTSLIKVTGTDSNGCKTDTVSLKTIVEKPIADSIYGSYSVCPNSSGIDYWVKNQKGSTYYWKISGGIQVSGGNTSHIKVDWGAKGGGWIKVYEITLHGCPGDTIKLNVTKDYVLYTSPIKGDTSLCEFSRGKVYTVSFSNGSVYAWKITGGTIIAGNGTASIVVDWDKAGKGALIVSETAYDPVNNKPCIGIPISVIIDIHPIPNTSEIIGPRGVCENDIVVYSVNGLPGSTYTWKFHGKTNLSTSDTARWQETGLKNLSDTFNIEVTELSKDSCPGQTKYLVVTVHKVPVTSSIMGPDLICFPKLSGAVYSVTGFPTSTYNWVVDGGTIVSGDKSPRIIVDWFIEGNRSVQVQEMSDFGCKGPEKNLKVKVDSLAMDIDLVTTNKANDKVIDLFWHVKNDEFFNGYFRILRSKEGQEYYEKIDSVPKSKTWYTDKNVNTSMYAYRYRIEAVNSCGYRIETNVHRTINLSAKFDGDTTINLHWNKYEGWPVDQYTINNTSNGDTTITVYNFTKDTSYAVIKTLDGYMLCMRIAAFKAGSGLNNVISWSNIVCVDFDPLVWIPNAFTPSNGDNLNNTYHIFAGNYKSYHLEIYNRWGERLFISDDPSYQWDGRFKGNICQEGVYLYMVNVTGAKRNIYKSGTLQLLR